MLSSFLILNALLSNTAWAEVQQKESYEYYAVIPKSGQSLLAALKDSTPLAKDNITRFGGTTWNVSPQYRIRRFSGSCYITQVNVQLDIKFILPKLSLHTKVSEDTRKKFDFFYKALFQHEIGHKKLGLEAATTIHTHLAKRTIFKSCQELHQTISHQIQDIINKYMSLNHDYDLRTDYGRTQGAVIKDVILVE